MESFERTIFSWTIPNYMVWSEKKHFGERESSREFLVQRLDGNDPAKFQLWFYPKGINEMGNEYSALFLYNCQKEDITINYAFYLEKTNGSLELLNTKTEKSIFERQSAKGYNAFRQELVKDNKESYLTNGALTISVIIEISKNDSDRKLIDNLITTTRLNEKYKEMFHEQNPSYIENLKRYSDVRIICDQDPKETFHCNKIILATGSPVFDAMFSHENTKEAMDNEVKITDIDSSTIRSMISFLYTGRISNHNIEPSLLAAADKYQIDDLKALCELNLSSNISESNAIDIAITANLHGTSEFKERTAKYVAESWNDLSRDDKVYFILFYKSFQV